jgi:starch-binding outer membrane protein, SusD/RagB family
MKKTNFINAILVVIAFCLAWSCSKDFLEANPQGAFSEVTLSNKKGVDAALISAYSMLDGWNNDWGQYGTPWPTAGSNWIWGSVASDDAYKGSEPGDQGEITEVELYNWLPSNTYFNYKFKALYEGIARSNSALKLAAKATDISATDQAAINGESRFLRGHYHFELWKLFGNVPYFDETAEEFRVPNDGQPTDKIIADFQSAADQLPEVQAAKGRANKFAAKAYLGKVYLYTNQYAKAKAELDAVVNSGKYALEPCFRNIFTVGKENGTEMIFSIQASANDGSGGGENGNFADRLNYPHGGPFGCCGFHQPSQNLVNAFKVDANGLPKADFNATELDPATDNVDPRLDFTVGRDDVPYHDWGLHAPSWIRSRSYAGPYSPKKLIYDKNSGAGSAVGWSNFQLSALNIPIIRYSDVLLMLAECEVELNNLERARELVNIVRARAAGCGQGPSSPVDIADPSITWAKYKVGTYTAAWTDQAAARAAVRMERRVELAMEGHRFFDLRRWGFDYASKTLKEYVAVEKTRRQYLAQAVEFQQKHMLYPIPQIQIILSQKDGTAQLKQNPGW